MIDNMEFAETPVCSGAATDPAEGQACEVCPPKYILSPEEESILARMRQIKEQVKPITARINELLAYERAEVSADPPSSESAESSELLTRLADLRSQWKRWQEDLDRAIEMKHINLGHREPS